jgi:site-specific recombinase XerD
MQDIHNYKAKLESRIKRIEIISSEEDRTLLLKFRDYCLCDGINFGKIDVYLFFLMKFREMLGKPIIQANREDIVRVLGSLNSLEWTEYTKNGFKIAIRKFYQIIYDMHNTGEFPDVVKRIKLNLKVNKMLLPEDLLTLEEQKLLIDSCDNLRDRAFMSVLCESGGRISEVATLKIKHVVFDNYKGIPIARLNLNGKTGPRRILVTRCIKELQDWIMQHPSGDCPEDYLWSGKKLFSYANFAKIIKHSAFVSGLTKKIYPHLFRHTRATELAYFMSDSELCEYMGWIPGSRMPRIYVHLSGRRLDDTIFRASGIFVQQDNFYKLNFPTLNIQND